MKEKGLDISNMSVMTLRINCAKFILVRLRAPATKRPTTALTQYPF